MKSLFALLTLFLSALAVSVAAKYADLVIAEEVPLAKQVDQFSADHKADTYNFVALAQNGTVVVQVRYETEEIGIEAYFTSTGKLVELLASIQVTIVSVTETRGLQDYGASLDTLQAYRYGGQSDSPLRNEEACPEPPYHELRSISSTPLKRASRCGQFCSIGRDCTDYRCPSCYYTGGGCYWQKSCLGYYLDPIWVLRIYRPRPFDCESTTGQAFHRFSTHYFGSLSSL